MMYLRLAMTGSLLLAGVGTATPAGAQDTAAPDSVAQERWDETQGVLSTISPFGLDRERLAQMAGKPETVPMMLRSLSAIVSRTQPPERLFGALPPELHLVNNSALPWSINDGDLWAGRGTSVRAGGGFFARFGRLQVVVAPELTYVANDSFELRKPYIESPGIPPDRSRWAFPWYLVGPYSIDMPTRFGEGSISRISFGQSSALVGFSKYQFGVANENEWWGPGISNALILSNNAPGFPHFFLRTARPLNIPLGDLDVRWLVGGLAESFHFDPDSSNDIRSLSAAAVTLRLKRPAGLTIGAARSVWATSTGWGEIPLRWFDVLKSTGRPNNRALNDSSLYPGGRDQVYSLFARWLFPEAGLEVFTEWGRTEFPTSLHDFLVAPNHTQAYTIGLQWRRPGWTGDDLWRLHAENTMVEQGPTFRDRPLGVWYTSRTVIQGYTNRGQPLGAAVGPGSSGQNLKLEYMRPAWSFGLEAGRMRYNEDVRSISPILFHKRWCTHDIYLYWGPRATVRSRFGFAAFDFTLANRYHPWFQVQSGCPRGDAMVDIRNNTLRLTFAPFMSKGARRAR
ncbi:MAG: capsule assembly Wzi family protein [Gemmatimonadaceae bacterium]|nr:capsule assembly Wzi family protein [Gemmatimonadaceae bacterium]